MSSVVALPGTPEGEVARAGRPQRLATLEAGRGLAALAVTGFHATGLVALPKYFERDDLWTALRWGDAGVDFFFVLSGFVIAAAHSRDVGRPERLLPYLAKRAWRIYPPYWVAFAAVWTAALLSPALRGTVPTDVPTLLRALALVPQDPAVVGGTGAPVIVAAWSLQYEVLFYAAFAVAIAAPRAAVLLLAGAAILVARLPPGVFPATFLSSPHLLQFAFGAAAGWAFQRDRLPSGAALPLAAVGLAGFAAAAVAGASGSLGHGIERALAYGIAATLLVCGLAQAERAGRLTAAPALAYLGTISYALYLTHFPVLSLLAKVGMVTGADAALRGPLLPLALCAACVLVAHAFHVSVERPLARLRARGARA